MEAIKIHFVDRKHHVTNTMDEGLKQAANLSWVHWPASTFNYFIKIVMRMDL
jgi:hypothetical protein